MDREITPQQRRKELYRKLAIYGCVLAVLVAAGVAVSSLSRSSVEASSLKWVSADRGTVDVAISGSGEVVPAFEEVINSPITSRIVEVYHRSGDVVDAGTPLIRLDLEATRTAYNAELDKLAMLRLQLVQLQANNRTRLSDLRMQIEVARMRLRRMEVELRNERYLDSIGSGTTDRVHEVELNRNSARLELAQLETQLANETDVKQADEQLKRLEIEIKEKELAQQARTLGDAEIRSPRHATVASIIDRLGSMVSAGQQVATIADLGHYRVEARFPESYAPQLKAGSDVQLKVNRTKLQGFVSSVSPTATNGMLNLSIAILNDSAAVLRSGVKADVMVSNGIRSDVVRIPFISSYTGPNTYVLYVRRPGADELERRDVKLGAAGMDYIEVLSGIAEGETVVSSDTKKFDNKPNIKLHD